MITVEQHLADVLALAQPPRLVRRSLKQCLGLALAEDVAARISVPPFTNSAMDGFAVRSSEVAAASAAEPVVLQVVGDVPAGSAAGRAVDPGGAIRVMTGAPLPPGADAVVPTESTDQPLGEAPLPARVGVRHPVTSGQHVRRAGEDVGVGDAVLARGMRLTAAALSSAASVGRGVLPVWAPVAVSVLATGSELVEPGVTPGPGQLPDSNSVLVRGLVTEAGGTVVSVQRSGDDPAEFTAALETALAADLVITTGGVSVGAFDVVRQVRPRGRLDFRQVAMQPGKPQGLGLLDAPDGRRVPLLAFPGNPVSVFVSFHLFARPLLAVMAGLVYEPRVSVAAAAVDWTSPPGRRQYVPVRVHAGRATPVHRLGSGSHLVASLPLADALAVVPEEATAVEAGEHLTVIGVDR